MICPHCRENVRYRERSNNTCSKCNKKFAFDPKTHPLLLSDSYFSQTITRLSNYNDFYFTIDQLRFFLSKKKLKKKLSPYLLIIPMIITTIIASVFYASLGILVFSFWVIFLIVKIRARKKISLPDAGDFNYGVLGQWKSVYGSFPDKLILDYSVSNRIDPNSEGILLCEDDQTAVCLKANQDVPNLAIITNENLLNEISQLNKTLPVFVLHNASSNGFLFFEKVKKRFGDEMKVIDIGFRPQSIIKSKLIKFWEQGEKNNFGSLTAEENKWLSEGFYTPLFILKPEKLIQYVTKQIQSRTKTGLGENVEQKARAVGFMTWAGE